MMYGTVDTLRERIGHLVKIRDLQDETGGFTAFFCWDFQHERGTRLRGGRRRRRMLYLRSRPSARLLLDNVDSRLRRRGSTQGPEVGQVALRFGADDFGQRDVRGERRVGARAPSTNGRRRHRAALRAAGFKAGAAQHALRVADVVTRRQP